MAEWLEQQSLNLKVYGSKPPRATLGIVSENRLANVM